MLQSTARLRPLLACLVLAVAGCTTAQSPSPAAPSAAASASAAASGGRSPTGSPSTSQPAPSDVVTLHTIADLVAGVQSSVVSVLRPDGGQGSGVIWSDEGMIVTNNHVVEGVDEMTIAFADGQRVNATVVATDPPTDLAVVQADRSNLPPATFADALPDVGELALALGNPIGFENSATQGIVSGLHRSIPGSAQQSAALVDLIQTDAAISPGNSGGALVNGEGEVMGINVAYIPPNSEAGAVSIGFAIPSPTVVDVVQQLLDSGRVEHAYLGIQPTTLTPSLAQQLGAQADSGVVVLAVASGGPADQAGMAPGDIITAVDGARVETTEDLLAVLRGYAPGDEVTVTYVRNGAEQEASVTLGNLPTVG